MIARAPNVTLSDGYWSDVLFLDPSTKVILLMPIHILVCLFLRKAEKKQQHALQNYPEGQTAFYVSS